MTDVKKTLPSSSFMKYTAYIREELGRNLLTKEECAIACQFYINGKSVDSCIDKLKKGEK